jgi:hypothetical protein
LSRRRVDPAARARGKKSCQKSSHICLSRAIFRRHSCPNQPPTPLRLRRIPPLACLMMASGIEEEGRGAFEEQDEDSATSGDGSGGGSCEQTSSRKRLSPSTQSSRFQQRLGSALLRPRKQLVPNTQSLAWYDSSSIPGRWRRFFTNPWQMRLPSRIWLH